MAVVQRPAAQTGQYLCASQNLPGLAGLRCVWSDLPGLYCESEPAGAVLHMVLTCPVCLLDTKQLQTGYTLAPQQELEHSGERFHLYNALPRHPRDFDNRNVERFKMDLDEFLWILPVQQKLPHYYSQAEGKSIIDQLAQRRADGRCISVTTCSSYMAAA
ncbi:hypothetical protein O3P69_015998 [Scylla paramamosain]|uniref:Uncharacterized protein n=1 Tax=Scylla paramamosain TaxID=85552 RepID=A0AAW0T8X9_SCYPA